MESFVKNWRSESGFDKTIKVKTPYHHYSTFTDVFKAAAYQIRSSIQNTTATFRDSKGRKVIVLHLRGTDRPCFINSVSPDEMIDRLKLLGAHKRNTTLYLMTNERPDEAHVVKLRHYYSPFMFEAANFSSLFESEPFSTSGYLIFAVELQLGGIVDGGFIDTYGPPYKGQNCIGLLTKDGCRTGGKAAVYKNNDKN